ncbi:MAG: hypothetical protein ACI308_02780 [Muribaculaceae bacterium]
MIGHVFLGVFDTPGDRGDGDPNNRQTTRAAWLVISGVLLYAPTFLQRFWLVFSGVFDTPLHVTEIACGVVGDSGVLRYAPTWKPITMVGDK